MLSKIDYKFRSLLLKIDRRDYLSSGVLNFLYKLLNPIKILKQFQKGLQSKKDSYLDDNGYLQMFDSNQNQNTVLREVLETSQSITQNKEIFDNTKKEFLQTYKINFYEEKNHIFLKLLFENQILEIVQGYLGKYFTLKDINILYSPNKNFEKGRSQESHMDGDAVKQIKIFLYLSDVDKNSGPFTVLSKSHSKNVYQAMKKKKIIFKKTNRISDVHLSEINYKNFLEPLYGKKGTINFVDTSNCYHFGSRPGANERYVLLYQFLDSFSYYLPSFSNKEKIRSSSILRTKEVKIMNNIISYSSL